MPKKVAKSEPKKDAHKSKRMVRINAEAAAVLDAICAKTHRPYTTEILLALKAHAKLEGVKLPDSST